MATVSLMFFRQDCMGCHACEVACKQEHGLGVGPRLVRVLEDGADFTPVYCHHCAKAPCKQACPADAIRRTVDGRVLIDPALCIGCKECMEACPFGAMQFDDQRDVAVKCDMCIQRIENGQRPACSSVCATGCIYYGETRGLPEWIAEARRVRP